MKDLLRALRRHHATRLKKYRQHYWECRMNDPVSLGKIVVTPCPCSCWMCGNPRKYFHERRLNERRDDQKVDDELIYSYPCKL